MEKSVSDNCRKCFYWGHLVYGGEGCLNYGDTSNEYCPWFTKREPSLTEWENSLKRHQKGGENNV